ncbi:MAG: hypothetical protein EPO23_01715 [Xanthobacteraceae bacterium]|nr:MAG: hypothetical protein EPO23_01715 [Xanthobacteraceae bacterium]
MRPARALMPAIAVAAFMSSTVAASAQTLPHQEPPEGELRLGQRVLVDDGSCPAGQIKQVTGARLTPSGVIRTRECIPRKARR